MKHIIILLLLGMSCSSVVFCQATRTWVSGVGDDVNPCSRTAPCKTFAGAISKTAAGGEISVLDPGGYGAVVITKSITINGEGSNGSILFGAGAGISIQGSNATMKVVLKNINIIGITGSVNGIRWVAGEELHLENVTIAGLSTGGGAGIDIINPTDCVLNMDNVKIFPGDKSNAVTAGIRANAGDGTSVKIHAKNLLVEGCSIGVNLVNNAFFSADNSVIHNTTTGLLSQGNSKAVLNNSEVVFNGTGLSASGANAEIAVKGSNISHNSELGSGIGKIFSYGGNVTYGNTIDFPLIVRPLR